MTRAIDPAARPVLRTAHLALTVLLLLALTAVAVLAGTGRLQYRAAAPPANEAPAASDKVGRYRIEPVEDARRLLEIAGPGGFFGQEHQHVWVFRYQGGFLECRLENESDGGPVASPPLPSNWRARLARDDRLALAPAGSFATEGYVLVTTRKPAVPFELDPHSYAVHLGGLFGVGPAGPLHPLMTLHLEARVPQVARLFVSVNPPREGAGSGFNAIRDELMLVRFGLVAPGPPAESQRVGQGKDLEPGQDVVLLDWRRGLGGVRLKGRFLPDAEAARYAAGE